MIVVKKIMKRLGEKYPQLIFEHKKQLLLSTIINDLRLEYPEYSQEFSQVLKRSYIKPDGGFLYATDKNGSRRLILIAEVKRQGTNDKRKDEGLPKQARGNAVERLGKNLIGIRAIFKKEEVIPFVCFGSGDDFKDESTIRDRVVTMNDFFPLKKLFIQKNNLPFEPVSMFFRHKDWKINEMLNIITDVAEMAIKHYFPIS